MNKMLLAMLAILVIPGQVMGAGDVAAGKTKSAACAACHAADGNSMVPNFPKLAGQHEQYLLKQMQDFKSGARKDPTMSPQVAALSEQDLADIAAYYSEQKASGGSADEKLVARGELLYRGGDAANNLTACIGCHGPAGAGNPGAKFPKISGQYAAYTAKQLKNFRQASRNNDAGKMMQNVALKMSDADIEAVASYIEGLH